MAKGILLVFSQPLSAEVDEAYNRWYDEIHLPEVLQLAGFTTARRFRLSEHQVASQGGLEQVRSRIPSDYAAIYEVEADDLSTATDALNQNSKNLTVGDAMDYGSTLAVLFEETTSR